MTQDVQKVPNTLHFLNVQGQGLILQNICCPSPGIYMNNWYHSSKGYTCTGLNRYRNINKLLSRIPCIYFVKHRHISNTAALICYLFILIRDNYVCYIFMSKHNKHMSYTQTKNCTLKLSTQCQLLIVVIGLWSGSSGSFGRNHSPYDTIGGIEEIDWTVPIGDKCGLEAQSRQETYLHLWPSSSNGLECGSSNGIHLTLEFGGLNFSIFSAFAELHFILFTEKFELSLPGTGKSLKFRFLKALYLCKIWTRFIW